MECASFLWDFLAGAVYIRSRAVSRHNGEPVFQRVVNIVLPQQLDICLMVMEEFNPAASKLKNEHVSIVQAWDALLKTAIPYITEICRRFISTSV